MARRGARAQRGAAGAARGGARTAEDARIGAEGDTRGRYPRNVLETPGTGNDVDIKPRSRVVTDGIEATTSRGMLLSLIHI